MTYLSLGPVTGIRGDLLSFMTDKRRLGACGFTMRPWWAFWWFHPCTCQPTRAWHSWSTTRLLWKITAWPRPDQNTLSLGSRRLPKGEREGVNQRSSVPFPKPTSQIKYMGVYVQSSQDCHFSWNSPTQTQEVRGQSFLPNSDCSGLCTCFV